MEDNNNPVQEDTVVIEPVVDHEKNAKFWKTVAVFFITLFLVYVAASYVDKLDHAETLRELHTLQSQDATLNAMAEARPASDPDRIDPE